MERLHSDEDWENHLKRLDPRNKYRHSGKPQRYPCIVTSEFSENLNSMDEYWHDFFYSAKVDCPVCGCHFQALAVAEE